MKLERTDILALAVLAMGLLVMCLSSNPGAREVGFWLALLGAAGCVMAFLFGGSGEE